MCLRVAEPCVHARMCCLCQGLLANPKDFGKQLGSSAATLLRGTTAGLLVSVGKITGALSRGVKVLDSWDNTGNRQYRHTVKKPKS